MKKTILVIAIALIGSVVKAQTKPQPIKIQSTDIEFLGGKIDTVQMMLMQTSMPANQVSAIMNKIMTGANPLFIAYRNRLVFVADSLKKTVKK